MKRTLLFLSALLISSVVLAQAPNAFKYQAVVRDNSGGLITEQSVGFQTAILKGTADGTNVYTETHAATTNGNGLVSLSIGTGTTTDDFSTINWEEDKYFIQISLDATGGTSYELMGTSQLISVPYALHANTAEYAEKGAFSIKLYTTEGIDTLQPFQGDVIFNSTENLMQVFDGSAWQALHTTCWPQPTSAYAGEDIIYDENNLSASLAANSPEPGHGTGMWIIVEGDGGSFADDSDPGTLFTGILNEVYTLRWTISTSCGSSSDDVRVSHLTTFEYMLTGGPAMANGKAWKFSPTSRTGDGIFYADADMTLQDPIPDGILGLIGIPTEYEDEFVFHYDMTYTHAVKNDSAVADVIFAALNGLGYRETLEDLIVLAPFTPAAATFTLTEDTDLTLEVIPDQDFPEDSEDVTWSNVTVLEIEGGTEFVGIMDYTRKYIIFDISVDHMQIGFFISTTQGSKYMLPTHFIKMTLIPAQ